MTYALLLIIFTDLDGPAIALAILSMPLFSYMGIVSAEAGMIDLKDLKPYLMRLYPSTRRRLLELPRCRRKLQSDFREFVRMIGPTLRDVYTEEKMDWAEFQMTSREITKSYSKDD
jgi:glycerol-3-phosphate O-acyltransferase/dihydroxyacetone phosphate acyltransferase